MPMHGGKEVTAQHPLGLISTEGKLKIEVGPKQEAMFDDEYFLFDVGR